MTGIICALKIEADGLKQSMENPKIKTVAGLDFIKSIKNIMEKAQKASEFLSEARADLKNPK